MPEPGARIPLETFLAELTEEKAADARAAARRIDMLERQVGPPGWLERNLISLALIALAFFVVGAGALIGAFAWLRSVIGIGGISLLVAAFPVLMFVYLVTVRGRTAVDNEKMRLNDRYFLPNGAVYFRDAGMRGPGFVLRVEPRTKGEPTLRERTEAHYAAATKRRW